MSARALVSRSPSPRVPESPISRSPISQPAHEPEAPPLQVSSGPRARWSVSGVGERGKRVSGDRGRVREPEYLDEREFTTRDCESVARS